MNKTLPIVLLAVLIFGISAGIVFLVRQSPSPPTDSLTLPPIPDIASSTSAKGPDLECFKSQPCGFEPGDNPLIAHVATADLDGDGLMDIITCDMQRKRVTWIRQSPKGAYTESLLGEEIASPAHADVVDVDGDGDLDILVASMGVMFPSNDKIGSVIVLENDGKQQFTNRVLAENIARVTDVRGKDLDADGDVDLAVGQFGYDQGEIRWMRNDGDWKFESTILLNLSGTIHTPIVDIDGDGDPDIVALVSQEWEEVFAFENDGEGNFTRHLLYGCADDDYGSSGIWPADLDADGDLDIVYTNGDAFVDTNYRPLPTHGIQWLENIGPFKFTFHRIADFPGAYGPVAADIDADGDLDIIAVSCFNFWDEPDARSMRCFENDGRGKFIPRDISAVPTHLLTVAAADMNGDGRIDLVTGGFPLYPPMERIGRVHVWTNSYGR